MSYKGFNILAVIPARGGSKGIPRKNLCKVGGISLIAHAVKFAKLLTWVDKVVLSTDDQEIAEEGCKYGAEVPFLRPPELSADFSTSVDTWHHAWLKSEECLNQTFDLSILFPPTTPIRKTRHVEESIKKLVEGGYDSVLTVSETDSKYHPLKQLVVENDHVGYYADAGKEIVARQQLNPVYHRNGVAYVVTRKCLVENKTIISEKTTAVIISDPIVNIDTKDDLERARYLMSR